MFKRILVANRGEIAVRIIKTLRELNIESVAIYSEPDKNSMHCAMADFSIGLPGASSAETYLNIPLIIEAIKSSGADGVHPGYGFLSENADFREAVDQTAACFIGPSKNSLDMMGDKIKAKKLMEEFNIPTVPGLTAALHSEAELIAAVEKIGYPVILKAAAGGGGRGMRIVNNKKELWPAFEACQREAQAYFGNPEVFCEKYIANPRHIEFQILFDSKHNGVHLFERDCSIQRRHQKLFEEAPSSYLNEDQRKKWGETAVKVGKAAKYCGAGTVEFICESPDKVYFMEMNPRIQVEHPVTESITGVDLIAQQILVAAGKALPFKQSDIKINGWSMEARINAEDSKRGFIPCPGQVEELKFPSGPFVRVDSHLYPGYTIPAEYDSMIAKFIVWAPSREQALQRLKRALSDFDILGVPTTARFHEQLLDNPKFKSGDFSTHFLDKESDYFASGLSKDDLSEQKEKELALLAAVLCQLPVQRSIPAPSDQSSNWAKRMKAQSVNRNYL